MEHAVEEIKENHHKSRSKTHVYYTTGLPKYYARLQTAVPRGLGLPARRLAGRHSDAAPKHSLCYIIQFPSRWSCASTYICKAETLSFTNCDYF